MYAINKHTNRPIVTVGASATSSYGTCPVYVELEDGTPTLVADTDSYEGENEVDLEDMYYDDRDNECSLDDIEYVETLEDKD